jgi:putative two-component system response regulator
MNSDEIPDSAYQPSVLIVDDTPANLNILSEMIREMGLRARPVPSGKLALQTTATTPPDLILLDIMMPEMDGFEICRRLKQDERLRDIPIIFISALDDATNKVGAFEAGGVDYITKPFQIKEVRARVNTHLKLRQYQAELTLHNERLQELVQAQIKEISSSQMAMIFALAKLAESRDDDTGKHLERVQSFCKMLAARLVRHAHYGPQISTSFIDNIYHASPLHDIGKVAIPDSILLKPDKLTPEEFEVMKTHPALGAATLEAVLQQYPKNTFIAMGIEIARCHHENWDGRGYPGGLTGESIPLAARILAVADTYDALRSKRCYKAPFSHEKSCEIILTSSGARLDPAVVNAFAELQHEFNETHQEIQD